MKELSNLRAPKGATHSRKRLGRGIGSRLGKTAGRGHGGAGQRKSPHVGAYFEGGQMPLQRRLPKSGFTNIFAKKWGVVNLRDLTRFESGSVVDEAVLRAAGLIKGQCDGIKVLGSGELTIGVTVVADKFSQSAIVKIEAAGGKAEVKGG